MAVKIERLMSGRRGENSLDECTTGVWLCGYRMSGQQEEKWTAPAGCLAGQAGELEKDE